MALADDLRKKGVLKNPRLIEAFRAVDRKKFVPKEFEDYAYIDEPLSIGEGQTISQPWTVAFMLELLGPKPGENIMEIGYGSGWQTALLAAVGANVWAIERVDGLCKWGEDNVKNFPLLTKEGVGEVKFFCQDGTFGLPEVAEKICGFDKIIVAAALQLSTSDVDNLPQAWKGQLKIGGKIVAPIGNSIFEFIKNSNETFGEREHPGFVFVPLVSEK